MARYFRKRRPRSGSGNFTRDGICHNQSDAECRRQRYRTSRIRHWPAGSWKDRNNQRSKGCLVYRIYSATGDGCLGRLRSGAFSGKWGTGGQAAAPIWGDYMQRAIMSLPAEDFAAPENVSFVLINPRTGKLAKEGTPGRLWNVL